MLLKMKHDRFEDVMKECSSMEWSIGKIYRHLYSGPLWCVSDKYPVTAAIYHDVVSQ